MLNQSRQQRTLSDAAIRQFLLAQLSANQRSALEAALFSNPQLEQRIRLAEMELIDDYAAKRLRANERAAFHEKFLVTSARQKKLEVSNALRKSLAADLVSQRTYSSAKPVFNWPRLGWRIAFALVALIVLFASALVIRREPQLVKHIIPKRFRPAAVATPTSEPAHHPTNSSEAPAHRHESPALPAHEASPQAIVLLANVAEENAPLVSIPSSGLNSVRLELMLERNESAAFSAVVTNSSGEVVHIMSETRVETADRLDLDIPIERLKAGGFRVTLTRITGEPRVAGTYYFRVP
jgi:hypothetical protein